MEADLQQLLRPNEGNVYLRHDRARRLLVIVVVHAGRKYIVPYVNVVKIKM